MLVYIYMNANKPCLDQKKITTQSQASQTCPPMPRSYCIHTFPCLEQWAERVFRSYEAKMQALKGSTRENSRARKREINHYNSAKTQSTKARHGMALASRHCA